MQLVSYDFEYCIMAFWGLRASRGTHMDALNHFSSKLMTNPKKRFVNLFGEISPWCAAAPRRR